MTQEMPKIIYASPWPYNEWHRTKSMAKYHTSLAQIKDAKQYTRSDLAVPIDRHEALVTKCAIYEDALTEIAAHIGHLGHIAEIALNQAKQRIK